MLWLTPPAALLPARPALVSLGSELRDRSLAGTIPAQYWDRLPALASIDLRDNSLTGRLQGAMPARLYELLASNNQLAGVADGWRPPPSLERLALGGNNISASFPLPWLPPDSGLVRVGLDSNRLRGSIPPDPRLPDGLQALT